LDAALLSSQRQDWNTPPEVLDIIRKFARIGLDPCSNARSKVKASASWLSGGLEVEWGGFGLVYVNPPYGRALGAWSEKIAQEALADTEMIVLVPSRTDTKWFHRLWKRCNALCLWKGRITFEGAPSPAPFPSAVFYFGPNAERFRAVFEDCGIILD
jgi:hypothetical protein